MFRLLDFGCCRLGVQSTTADTFGLKLIGGVTTDKACEEACAADSSCEAFELNAYVRPAACWLFHGAAGRPLTTKCDRTTGTMRCFVKDVQAAASERGALGRERAAPVQLLVYLRHIERVPLLQARYGCNDRLRLTIVTPREKQERCRELCFAACTCRTSISGARAHVNIAAHASGELDTLWLHADMWIDSHRFLHEVVDRHPNAPVLPSSANPDSLGLELPFHYGGYCVNASRLSTDTSWGKLHTWLGEDATANATNRAMELYKNAYGKAAALQQGSESHVSDGTSRWIGRSCYGWQDLVFVPQAHLSLFRAAALSAFHDVNQEIATPTILDMLSLAHGHPKPRFVECEGNCCSSIKLSSARARHAVCTHRVALDDDPLVREGAAQCARDRVVSLHRSSRLGELPDYPRVWSGTQDQTYGRRVRRQTNR